MDSKETIYNNDLQRDMNNKELREIFFKNKTAIDIAVALNTGLFNLSFQDYLNLPSKLINTIIFLKNEILKRQNESLKQNGN